MTRDKTHLLHIQENISKIQRLINQGKDIFIADEDKQAATLYYLQTLSESTTRLSEDLRDQYPEIAWQQIRGFRNRIVHDYLSIDLELVWIIITTELQPLQVAVTDMLKTLDTANDSSEDD